MFLGQKHLPEWKCHLADSGAHAYVSQSLLLPFGCSVGALARVKHTQLNVSLETPTYYQIASFFLWGNTDPAMEKNTAFESNSYPLRALFTDDHFWDCGGIT